MTTRSTLWLLAALLLAVPGCPSGGDGAADADADAEVDGSAADASADLPPDGEPDAEVLDGADDGDGGGAACEGCPAAHATIVDGLTMVQFDLTMSRVSADRTQLVPLVWASYAALGGDKRGLAGTLPAPGWLGMPGDGRLVVWAGHEGAWGPAGDGIRDNDPFRERILGWLLGGGRRVAFDDGHGEWLRSGGFSPALAAWLAAQGAAVSSLSGTLDAGALEDVDLLILGNPWDDFSDAELDALDAWVRGGGALLALGLGWSWPQYHDDYAGTRYPINRVGSLFGFHVMNGSIYDPDAPAGTHEMPAYQVRPLADFQPLDVVVLSSLVDDVGVVQALAAANPDAIYVIEGRRMGLQLPTRDWALLVDPAQALDGLDRVSDAELAMTTGHNPPFAGDIVWVVSVDDPDAAWWMHSGNPIVYRAAAAGSELIPRFNAEGHPGWGIAHEQGHNMEGESCGNLYVVDGTGEVWENVFGVYSYLQNGWDWTPQMGAALFDAGHAYHAQASPDFADLVADPFVLLGCLDLIWTRYGWDGMVTFMSGTAAAVEAGTTAGDDAARTAWFVEGLSAAYNVDFAPLIAHWGFTVSAASRAITSAFPACDITW